jgi:hypothetical protein
MNTAVQIQEVRIKDITVTEDTITAQLMDGRTISVPLAWSWRLSEATPKQRANLEIIGDGRARIGRTSMRIYQRRKLLYGIPAKTSGVFSDSEIRKEETHI